MEQSRRKFIKDITTIGLLTSTLPILSSFDDLIQYDYAKEKINNSSFASC